MRTAIAQHMRELDRRTIEEAGIPGERLMERAGAGLARAIRRLAAQSGAAAPLVLLVAGRGNNGGDAFVAARRLHERGCTVRVLLAGEAAKLQGDATRHFELMRAGGVPWEEWPEEAAWTQSALDAPEADIVVDGLLGTGSRGAPSGCTASAIAFINRLGLRARVVAVDLPSGLDPDTGIPSCETVRADLTVTFGLPKPGLLAAPARDAVGHLEVVDIGIPDAYVEALPASAEPDFIASAEVAELLPRRRRDSHKGTYGHVLLVGGAEGYAGAISLAARAAVRCGAGLVTVLTPRCIAPTVAALAPEAMVKPARETDAGSLDAATFHDGRALLAPFDAVLAGPGMTTHPHTLDIVQRLLRECRAPLVLDADALNVLAGRPALLAGSGCPLAITPHPGEMARLLGREAAEVQADRLEAVREAVRLTHAAIALKGSGTLVAGDGQRTCINLTGNPGMATGGSGDVLAGMVVSLLGQGMGPFDALRAAVHLHGLAGDLAAWGGRDISVTAGDLIARLPSALAAL